MSEFHHVSVLLEECIRGLNIRPDGIYVDGTLGGAGHSSRIAQIIVGPMGIAIADALMGEISPAMANAVAASTAYRVLIPMNLCNTYVAGVSQRSSAILDDAMEHIRQLLTEMGGASGL